MAARPVVPLTPVAAEGGATISRVLIVWLLVVLTVAAAATGALAHKGKLPPDALTLVQQATALLAQNAGMTGEAKERLQAALRSKQPERVDLQKVAAALPLLDRKDIPGARRLLISAITPAGMPKPPQDVRRTPASSTMPSTGARPEPSEQPSAPMLSMETAMRMTEPLRVRFGSTRTEVALLAVAVVLIAAGFLSLWAGREAAR